MTPFLVAAALIVVVWALISLVGRRALGSRAYRRAFRRMATEKIALSRAILETPGLQPEMTTEERRRWLRAEWPSVERSAERHGVPPEKLEELRRELFGAN